MTVVTQVAAPRAPADVAAAITNSAAHGDDRLHDAFTWLRENMPLARVEAENFDPFWCVTKHEDIRFLASKPDLCLSGLANISLIDREEQRHMREAMEGRPMPTRMIISMDQPDHKIFRALTENVFRAGTLSELESKIADLAREFIDRLAAEAPETDFAKTVAFVYPLRVIMHMMGIAEEDEPYLLKLTQEMVGNHDPDQSRSGKALSGAEAAAQFIEVVGDIFAYFEDLRQRRRAEPGDDLATLIAEAKVDGADIPYLESMSYYLVLATAGHDTTAASIAGAMIEICRNPELLPFLKEDPRRIKPFVEEAIRWVSPSKMTIRTAAEDFDLRGQQIRKGDMLALCWASANRDEDVFEDPFTFKADRRPNKLLAFGNGPHVCLGQHLARLEMRLLFEELVPRLKSASLIGEVRNVCSFQISGPKSAKIRFSME
jgi:cytochrome P450